MAFRTVDGKLAFPDFQFDRGDRLEANPDVVAVWQRLPHEGFLTDVDLVAWLRTPLSDLDATPAETARRRGADDPSLLAALARLRARARGPV